jgi:hypothetical protein
LLPGNGVEARLAAQFVALDAKATEYMRMARESRAEPALALRYDARAVVMMREGKSTLRILLKLQAARQVREGDEALAGQAAWLEMSVAGMMREALLVADAAEDVAEVSAADEVHEVWKLETVAAAENCPSDSGAETDVGLAGPGGGGLRAGCLEPLALAEVEHDLDAAVLLVAEGLV